MLRGFLALALAASPAFARDIPAAPFATGVCGKPDVLTIEDGGASVAVLTYSNSIEQCSRDLDQIMISPNGIKVRVIVSIGRHDEKRETLRVTPVDTQYLADPPESQVFDGETVIVIITAGTS